MTKDDVAKLSATVFAVLNFCYHFLSVKYPKVEMPNAAKRFIETLIQVSDGRFEFQMLDSEIMARAGIKSKNTVINGRKALIEYQMQIGEIDPETGQPTGIGLVNIIPDETSDRTKTAGTTYYISIFDIAATQTLKFIENGISPNDAMLATSAIANADEKTLKALPEDLKVQAEGLVEETALEVSDLPKPTNATRASAEKIKETKAEQANKKVEAEQRTVQTRAENLKKAIQAIEAYQTATDTEKKAELFEAYINGRLSEIRYDKTNGLTATEARTRLTTGLAELERLVFECLALTEKLPPEEAKADRKVIIATPQLIAKVATLSTTSAE
jgi:hypothetical protein